MNIKSCLFYYQGTHLILCFLNYFDICVFLSGNYWPNNVLSMITHCLFVRDVHEHLIIQVTKNYELHDSPDSIINKVI